MFLRIKVIRETRNEGKTHIVLFRVHIFLFFVKIKKKTVNYIHDDS